MQNRLKRIRKIDLTLFTIMAIIAEVGSELAFKRFSGAGFYISFSILIGIIAMIRWGQRGAIVYLIAGLPMVVLNWNDASFVELLVMYPIANGFIVLSSFMLLLKKRNDIQKSTLFLLLFEIAAFASVSIGRGMASWIIQGSFLTSSLDYFVNQLFSIVITFIVLLIVRRSKELLIDMEEYILTLQAEGEKDVRE
jgi:hypothetical protein